MRFINSNNNKLEKHIDYCQYMLEISTPKLKPYYFKKQIEVAQKKLKQIYKSE